MKPVRKGTKLNFVLAVLVGGIMAVLLYNCLPCPTKSADQISPEEIKSSMMKFERKTHKTAHGHMFVSSLQMMKNERDRPYLTQMRGSGLSGKVEFLTKFRKSVMRKYAFAVNDRNEKLAFQFKAEIKSFRLKHFNNRLNNRFKEGNMSAIAHGAPLAKSCKPEIMMFPPQRGRRAPERTDPFPKRKMFKTSLNRQLYAANSAKEKYMRKTEFNSTNHCVLYVEDISKYKKMRYKKIRAEVIREAENRRLPRIY